MKYVGVDLHKHVIKLCIIMVLQGKRKVVSRRSFQCSDIHSIRVFFDGLGPFQVVVEATSAYEWFFLLIEDLADRLVLAHPKKLRIIAESTRKTDKIDAEVLATFLALDMIPEAYRPSPRVQQYRVLVRHRHWMQGRITAVKCKIRNKAAHYNADVAELFQQRGQQHLADLAMNAADRFETDSLLRQLSFLESGLREAERQLCTFADSAPAAEREARAVLDSIPQIGPVTIDVVLSELGDWRRFGSAKAAVAYAGLDPGVRQSAQKRLDLHITKEGSRVLRWALIEAAWRLVAHLPRWRRLFERLHANTGSKKKAIVGVARHLLCTMFSMLQKGQAYRYAA
jgi:transposase